MCFPENIHTLPQKCFGLNSPDPLKIPNLHYRPISECIILQCLMSINVVLGIFCDAVGIYFMLSLFQIYLPFQTDTGLGPNITGSDETINAPIKRRSRFTKDEAYLSR